MPATVIAHRSTDDLPTLSVGRLVFDRYRLEKIAGRGGMGIVWRALDTKLERTVALKFLPDLYFQDHAARDDLKRETRRSLELTHPSIVRIYDFLEDEQIAAISMEYVDGATLSQRRVEQAKRFFECHDLAAWTATLCQALDYAHHSACCVHRDLKPGNLMITTRGALKVADFGIACGMQNTAARVSVFTSTGGTLGYMSPQQLAGELAAPSDDIYSLGATLYELLTTKPPFHGGDLTFQIREIVPDGIAERRRKLGLDGEAVDPRWERTIMACLSKDPSVRPASVMDVAGGLGLVQTKPALAAVAPTPMPIVVRPATRPLQHDEVERKQTALKNPFAPWLLEVRRCAIRNRRTLAACFAVAVGVAIWFRPHGAPSIPALLVAKAASARPAALVEATPAPMVQPSAPAAAPAALPVVPASLQASDSRALAEAARPRAAVAADTNVAKLQIITTPPGIAFRILHGAYETASAPAPITGISPALVDNLPSGSYRVEFAAEGLGERSLSVRLSAGATTPIEQIFPHGLVRIQSLPAGAEIFCDDQSVGIAPLELILAPGSHIFRAESDDDDSRPRPLVVKADGTHPLVFDFRDGTKSPGTVHRSRPRAKKPEPSMVAKIGKSITTFFTGNEKKKR